MQHEPVELEAADVHKEGLLGIDVADGGGHVVDIGSDVFIALTMTVAAAGAQQVHGRADQRLIRA